MTQASPMTANRAPVISLSELLRVALRALACNKRRSPLTMLGITVGATERDVQLQFLSESTILGLPGGFLAVLTGIAASTAVSNTLRWPTLIPPQVNLIAVVFSAAVGVFFGYYPAHKVAHLDPIEARRYK